MSKVFPVPFTQEESLLDLESAANPSQPKNQAIRWAQQFVPRMVAYDDKAATIPEGFGFEELEVSHSLRKVGEGVYLNCHL